MPKKLLYGLVSPSKTENTIIAISYNKDKLIEYYNRLKILDNDLNLILALLDVDIENNILAPFGKSEVTKI